MRWVRMQLDALTSKLGPGTDAHELREAAVSHAFVPYESV